MRRGCWTRKDVGREVKFGDLESVVYLLRSIARREGIGELLADGVKTGAHKSWAKAPKHSPSMSKAWSGAAMSAAMPPG